MDTLLPGIRAERMPTNRLTVNVLSIPDRTGPAVLFVHGNVSSSLFWQPMMLALPETYQPLAIDLRGFGDTDDEPIDATRGLRDFSDDLAAAIEALGLGAVHLVGWSMGGGVVLQHLTDRPDTVASLTLVDPVSPFGFGGTRGVDGVLCDPYGAGSGGGGANPEFVERLAGQDRTDKSPLSPRQVLLAHYVKPPHVPEHLDIFVESMLSTRTGEYWYPGDSRPVDAWPGFAPGDRGVLNTMAPTHFRIASLSGVEPKPPVLWIRGADDVIVSDTSLYDLAYLGSLGAIPGWPGEQAWPPQPMVARDSIEVSVRLEDANAVFAVADSGCGIPPADLDHIFGRFARAEPYRSRKTGGFGLGLPIAAAIAEAHHGSVRVHSTSGQGATFEMVIPAA